VQLPRNNGHIRENLLVVLIAPGGRAMNCRRCLLQFVMYAVNGSE
jgi:hypothetical protein